MTESFTAKEKISIVRTKALTSQELVFWSTIGFHLQPSEVPDDHPMWRGHNATMATDGQYLYYSPKFVERCSLAELLGVFVHEIYHVALGHHLRQGERLDEEWNWATDFAINLLVTGNPLNLKLPKGVLLNERFKGMSAERIYEEMKVLKLDIPPEAGIGQVLPSKGGAEEEAKWDIIVRSAAYAAQNQGHLPGGFEEYVRPYTVKLDVSSMIRHMFSIVRSDDYTWAKPNRKHIHRGIYIPTQSSESTGDVAVFVDNSGSVPKDMLAKFIGVVNVVLSDLRPRICYFGQCDADVQTVTEYTAGQQLPVEVTVKGRGGTDMRPIWEWAKEKHLSCAVVCSDFYMDTASFGEEQKFPVLWVTSGTDLKAPWGKTARLE